MAGVRTRIRTDFHDSGVGAHRRRPSPRPAAQFLRRTHSWLHGAPRWLAPGSEVVTDGLGCWNAFEAGGRYDGLATGTVAPLNTAVALLPDFRGGWPAGVPMANTPANQCGASPWSLNPSAPDEEHCPGPHGLFVVRGRERDGGRGEQEPPPAHASASARMGLWRVGATACGLRRRRRCAANSVSGY